MYFAAGKVYLANNEGSGVYRVDHASISLTDLTVQVVYVSPSVSTSAQDGMNCLAYGDPFPEIPDCPPPPYPEAAAVGTVNYGRCGEDYGGLLCAESAGRFCNEANGYCGDTAAHRDAQTSTTYDSSRLPDLRGCCIAHGGYATEYAEQELAGYPADATACNPGSCTFQEAKTHCDSLSTFGTATEAAPTVFIAAVSAAMRSAHSSHPASICIDGDLTTDYCHSHPDDAIDPWLQIDLGTTHNVARLTLYNRHACCWDRIAHHQIWLSDSSTTPATKCFDGTAGNSVGPFVEECIGTGRYIRIVLPGASRLLNLAEVKVFGSTVASTNGCSGVTYDDYGRYTVRAGSTLVSGVYMKSWLKTDCATPTAAPTDAPTAAPTPSPTAPTEAPTAAPSHSGDTNAPTAAPTNSLLLHRQMRRQRPPQACLLLHRQMRRQQHLRACLLLHRQMSRQQHPQACLLLLRRPLPPTRLLLRPHLPRLLPPMHRLLHHRIRETLTRRQQRPQQRRQLRRRSVVSVRSTALALVDCPSRS
jgi:hypothetical protein